MSMTCRKLPSDFFSVPMIPLSIYFREDQAKLIVFASKFKRKNIQKLNIKYVDIQIKQHSKVKYLGCLLDETMSGEAVALNIIIKLNNKLKVLHHKNSFLTLALRPLLSNALIQPHFNYASITRESLVSKSNKENKT